MKNSLYKTLYQYLCNNYEPNNLDSNAETMLINQGLGYCARNNMSCNIDDMKKQVQIVIDNFNGNNGQKEGSHGLGQTHENQFDNIRDSLSDLRW